MQAAVGSWLVPWSHSWIIERRELSRRDEDHLVLGCKNRRMRRPAVVDEMD